MVLHDERTLKSTIQKNLPKSQIFARKTSFAEFRYSQTNLLWFTVILVHSNLDEKVTCNEQRAKSNDQRSKSSASCELLFLLVPLQRYIWPKTNWELGIAN